MGVLLSSQAWWAPMLGFNNRRLANSNEGRTKKMNSDRTRGEWHKSVSQSFSPRAGCLRGSIYSGTSRVLLQCLKCP
jgi:hypothetical protein